MNKIKIFIVSMVLLSVMTVSNISLNKEGMQVTFKNNTGYWLEF